VALHVVHVDVSDGVLLVPIEVYVMLTDVNEAPKFAKESYSMAVSENSATGTTVGETVKASDHDAGDIVEYKLLSGSNSEYFELDTFEDSGYFCAQMKVRTTIPGIGDFAATTFDLALQIMDTTGLTVERSVEIAISGTNGPPVMPECVFTTREDAAVGTLLTVTGSCAAVEPDGDGLVYFSDPEDAVAPFRILASRSGALELVTNEPMDFESEATYSFTVFVKDTVPLPLVDSGRVTVNILDVNEEPSLETASVYIEENSPMGTQVTTALAATDPDTNSEFTFSMADGRNLFGTTSDGFIYLEAGSLDFEGQKVYSVQVKVSDNGDPQRSAVGNVVIHVLDANDPPRMTDTLYREINENAVNGAVVGSSLVAYDQDVQGSPQTLEFSLVGGNVLNSFGVTKDGQVFVQDTDGLSFEREQVVQLKIRVSDTHLTPAHHEDVIQISIVDVNEPPSLAGGYRHFVMADLTTVLSYDVAVGVDGGAESSKNGCFLSCVNFAYFSLTSDGACSCFATEAEDALLDAACKQIDCDTVYEYVFLQTDSEVADFYNLGNGACVQSKGVLTHTMRCEADECSYNAATCSTLCKADTSCEGFMLVDRSDANLPTSCSLITESPPAGTFHNWTHYVEGTNACDTAVSPTSSGLDLGYGQACVFPFMYAGVVHTSCSGEGNGMLPGQTWCSTDPDGVWENGDGWGYCKCGRCSCDTPGDGTDGNSFFCDDETNGRCESNEECYATQLFDKAAQADGCRVPKVLTWTRGIGGTVDTDHNTVSGLTLAECKQACEDGTWADCVAFARYNPDTDLKARGGANVPSDCWWVTQAKLVLYNDEDGNNKIVYKLTPNAASRLLQEETGSGDDDGEDDMDGISIVSSNATAGLIGEFIPKFNPTNIPTGLNPAHSTHLCFKRVNQGVALKRSLQIGERNFEGTEVLSFVGIDVDTKTYWNTLSWAIVAGNEDGKFGIYENGTLYIEERLDFEVQESYKLKITVRDGGGFAQKVELDVQVLDENEPPNFENMEFDLNENDVSVFTLEASDQDHGQTVSFSFTGSEESDWFTLNSATGEMKNLRLANFEEATTFTMKIRATDNAAVPMHQDATVTFHIKDKNDPPDLGAKMELLSESTDVITDDELLPDLSAKVETEETCTRVCYVTPQVCAYVCMCIL
jgi:hypothetical protein